MFATRFLTSATFALTLLVCAIPFAAQELAAQESATPQATEFTELLSEWEALKERLSDAKIEFEAIEGDDSVDETERLVKLDEIQKEYQTLADEANVLVDELKSAGLAVIKEDSSSAKVVRTLLGIMVNDAASGNDEDVLETGQRLIDVGINPRYFEVAADSDRLEIAGKEIFEELRLRHQEALTNNLPRVKFVTSQGEIVIELYEDHAPETVGNFISLVESGFYKGIKFHRVMSGFMAQAGCPKGDGSSGPGYMIYSEADSPEARKHFTGVLSMANRGPNTGGSQFFLTFRRTSGLDGGHTVFGRVVSGMEVARKLTITYADDPLSGGAGSPIPGVEADTIQTAEVVRKREHEYVPHKVEDSTNDDKEEMPKTQPDGK